MSTFQILKCPMWRTRVGVKWPPVALEPLENETRALSVRRVVYVMQWHFLVQHLKLIKCVRILYSLPFPLELSLVDGIADSVTFF